MEPGAQQFFAKKLFSQPLTSLPYRHIALLFLLWSRTSLIACLFSELGAQAPRLVLRPPAAGILHCLCEPGFELPPPPNPFPDTASAFFCALA